MKIARVFPRKTNATPTDDLAFVGAPLKKIMDKIEVDEVHVSVAFTYDMPRAEELALYWERLGIPVRMGGPALGEPGGDFVPGQYMKQGYVITSRGCRNHCWFCSVWKRENGLRELPIVNGYIVQDDNLLACSDTHINAVFDMLAAQKEKAVFSGGLEAKLLEPWHAQRLRNLRPARLYMAYDTPDDYEPLVCAGKMLQGAGFTVASHIMACYVLIGYKGDTFERADKRLYDTIAAGFVPYAMLYRNENGLIDPKWRQFQRTWVRPEIVASKMKEALKRGP